MTRLVVLRASHVSPDPRVERAAAVAAGRGLEVEVLAWDREGNLDKRSSLPTASILRFSHTAAHGRGLANLGGLALFQLFLAARLLCRRRGLGAIHACDLSTGVTGLLMARILRVPLIYDVFDYYADSFPVPRRALPLVRRLETYVLESADEVILAAATRQAQILPADPQRVTIVENSPNLANEPVRPDPALTPTDLAYVGILAHGRLLREIVGAVQARPDITLRIAGFGPLGDDVAAAAAQCDNIDFVGAVAVERGLQIMSASTIMFATYDPAVPNHRFSAPNKFAEALALGKPLIVCTGTSIDVPVAATGFGEVIAYDADAFIESVDRIKADSALLELCRSEGPACYAAHHSWAVNAERLSDLYARTVLSSGGNAS